MKKILVFAMILMCVNFSKTNAQISIRKNNVVEKPIFKPKQFDSLTNIIMQEHPVDYKKYIGYKLFFLPKSTNYKTKSELENQERLIDFLFSTDTIQIEKKGNIPFEETTMGKIYLRSSQNGNNRNFDIKKKNLEEANKEKTNIYKPHFYHYKTDRTNGKVYGKIGTTPDSVYGKYFTILNIEGKDNYNSKKYRKLDNIEIEDGRSWHSILKIKLRNEENKEILYWTVRQSRLKDSPFFLVPYFEKQKEIYLNKNLVLKNAHRTNTKLQNLIDVNTGEKINIKYGEPWTCSDISFIESKDSFYLKCFYFLKKGNKEVKIPLESELFRDYFMLETEFKQQKLAKQKLQIQRQKEVEARRKKAEQKRIIFKKECIAKWGQKMGACVADGKVLLGMNKEMCMAAWGNPIDKFKTLAKGLTIEQWVYGWGTFLYFDNEKLTTIQE
ncbi:MAG: hypothetical protein N4A49_01415 [Marinifilaceae bacterium]|jgi:hypothetical protein|nr:hypothetical protein [Marinifilaceae bacterium]